MAEDVKNGLAMKFLSLIPDVSWKIAIPLTVGIVVLSIYAFPKNHAIMGEWDCGTSKYVFTKQGWSAPGSPSKNLQFKIEKGYVFLETLARESLPLLKFHDGKLFVNMDGTGVPDGACTKSNK